MNSTLSDKGYEIIEGVFTKFEVDEILNLLEAKKIDSKFGVREFLLQNREIAEKVFNENLLRLIGKISIIR